jgi:hypothetical protein
MALRKQRDANGEVSINVGLASLWPTLLRRNTLRHRLRRRLCGECSERSKQNRSDAHYQLSSVSYRYQWR